MMYSINISHAICGIHLHRKIICSLSEIKLNWASCTLTILSPDPRPLGSTTRLSPLWTRARLSILAHAYLLLKSQCLNLLFLSQSPTGVFNPVSQTQFPELLNGGLPPPPRTPSDTEASFGRFCILSTHLPGLWVFKDSGLVFFLQPCLLHGKRSQSGRESLQTCGFASWSPVLVRATIFTSGTYSRQICNEEVVSLAARKSLLPDGKSQMVENFADFKTTLLMTFKFRLGGI